MATLVLTVVGGVVGGPIGAALGAAIGQQIDRNVLFPPKGRQGPRLTELKLQTSSYGTAIPLVFGTMRIGGCVIWATDLIESRSTSRAGKGQPKVTSYSYSASFAVALSGRRIAGVGRIWADGKLLRGSAGDFKSQTGFRLHLGDEDQAVDPGIAAAENGMAPAHRGLAYAVFEDFQLADYGNRIPSLTFEVVGDTGAVSVGDMVRDLSGGVVSGAVALPLPGFAASGEARGVLEMLAAASGAWFAPVGRGLALCDGLATGATLADAGVGNGAPGAAGVRSLKGIESVARSVTCAHYDPARDYQTGLQRARRPGAGTREGRIELPAAVGAELAKGIAQAQLARDEAGRERRTLALGWDALGVVPGACIAIAGTPGVFRVMRWTFEKAVVTLDCVRLAAATAPVAADAGRVSAAPDAVAGTTILHAVELPPLDDGVLAAPRLTIAAAGTGAGWRRAALLHSLDGGAHWVASGATEGVATLGVVVQPPGFGSANLVDRVNTIVVDLAHGEMALAGADDAALDAGANLALVGDELLQFGVAEQIGALRWRVSRLWRGRRGSEAAIGAQPAGDRFVLIEAAAGSAIELPAASLGTVVKVLASGIGDTAGPVACDVVVTGRSVLPPAPVHGAAMLLTGGDMRVTWVRRSRAGWRWIDGADVPLGEEREAYRVMIAAGGTLRQIEPEVPWCAVTAAERAAGPVTVTVRQTGVHGESAALTLALPAL